MVFLTVTTRTQAAHTAAATRAALAVEGGEGVDRVQHVKTCFDFATMLNLTIPAARKWMDQIEKCVGTPPDSPTSLSEVTTPSLEAATDARNNFSATQLRERLAEVQTDNHAPLPASDHAVFNTTTASAPETNASQPSVPDEAEPRDIPAASRHGRTSPLPTAKSLKRKHRSNPAYNNGQGGPRTKVHFTRSVVLPYNS